jgi:hypothetical protein
MVDANLRLRVVSPFRDVTHNGCNGSTRITIALVELNFDGIIVLNLPAASLR